MLPEFTTHMLRTASSSRSTTHFPSLSMEMMNLVALLPNSELAVLAMRLVMSVYPTQVVLPCCTTFPGAVVATLPPASAARSTVTDPGGMASTISWVIRTGAFLPGMRAVVMMALVDLHSSRSIFRAASNHSGDISLAYPPAASPDSSVWTSRNLAPMDSTCSLAADRTSKAVTTALRFFACWMAASPATPAPTTITRAGFTLPAAVICPAKGLCMACAASTTAR
mmetsp:Transcript_2058/g.5705  ORF Transcript_2058/g.5705 Transcript_2058/m.5705 type:complete len:225 (-) Transcript_2058:273-947(-)